MSDCVENKEVRTLAGAKDVYLKRIKNHSAVWREGGRHRLADSVFIHRNPR